MQRKSYDWLSVAPPEGSLRLSAEEIIRIWSVNLEMSDVESIHLTHTVSGAG